MPLSSKTDICNLALAELGARRITSYDADTTVEANACRLHLDHVIDKVDLVLLMSVNPGFGGQAFIPSALEKLAAVRRRIDESGRDIWLEIDGGVKAGNIESIARAGADTFVAGSAVFGPKDRAGAVRALRDALKRATMPA